MAERKVVGIAKVVIRSRQHLAALKPKGQLLVLEILHFSEELVDATAIRAPNEATASPKEMDLAKTLIGSMVSAWHPEKYHDDYRSALMEVIQEKIKPGKRGKLKPAPSAKPPSNVVDMVEVLKRSLRGLGGKSKPKAKSRREKQAA